MQQLENKINRLNDLRKIRPEYSEIYDYQQQLCEYLQKQSTNWLNVQVDHDEWEMRRKNGFPLLTGTKLQIEGRACSDYLMSLTDILGRLGKEGREELKLLKTALEKGLVDSGELFEAYLDKNRAPFETVAVELSVPPALIEYVISTALAHGLQNWLAVQDEIMLDGWSEGYCPVCGGAPLMGELYGDEGKKRLHCSICACNWEVTRLQCCYCGNEESDSLSYFTAEGIVGYRVDVCRKCSCYLKVVDSREVGSGLPMDVEDLNTMHFDLMAQKEGFTKGKRTNKEPDSHN